jgi:hypothetical protein
VRPGRAIFTLEAQMDRKTNASRLGLLLLLGLTFSVPPELAAQVPVDENGQPLTAIDYEDDAGADVEDILALPAAELEELVGRIALYPDDLLAIVLPASTYPLEIVQAARFLDDLAIDGSLQPDEAWDESVVALLNYPEVVHMMNDDIDWTWRLGEAVISQQTDIIAAVESFRDRAYAAGNLESDERQTVSKDNGVIEIEPVDEEIIYVPYYEPEEVIVYQPRRRVYYYYPQAYPVYYYPYPYGYSFASGYFWGVTTAYTIGWNNHYLYVHHPSYLGHPYYGRHYYGHYYRYPSISVYNRWYVRGSHRSSHHRYRDGDHWRPRHRSGARPETRSVRNRHYPSDGGSNDRTEHRSTDRTRQDMRERSRTQSRANINRRARPDRSNDAVIDGRTDIQFRDRNGAARVPANRRVESGRSSSDRQNRTTGSSANRQRLTAQNSRQVTSNARTNRSPQQNVTTRQQPTATRTPSRSGASQRPATPRSATRPTVQRQAPAPRPSSRPAVQRQAPVQRAAPSAAPQRQQSNRQATSSSRRGSSRSNPRRKQEH